eukprot:TRINITY_DN10658_c0_g1_i1.p1 TRINITY_DN10658_c0_g1~~TRINITY_DN10658_c0_g1_i1.p1  ORF type:complete len:364 (+),score=7.06 TRINITY_DN10658_c0_g1_i1:46-1137(+)
MYTDDLKNCLMVSKNWYNIGLDYTLWKSRPRIKDYPTLKPWNLNHYFYLIRHTTHSPHHLRRHYKLYRKIKEEDTFVNQLNYLTLSFAWGSHLWLLIVLGSSNLLLSLIFFGVICLMMATWMTPVSKHERLDVVFRNGGLFILIMASIVGTMFSTSGILWNTENFIGQIGVFLIFVEKGAEWIFLRVTRAQFREEERTVQIWSQYMLHSTLIIVPLFHWSINLFLFLGLLRIHKRYSFEIKSHQVKQWDIPWMQYLPKLFSNSVVVGVFLFFLIWISYAFSVILEFLKISNYTRIHPFLKLQNLLNIILAPLVSTILSELESNVPASLLKTLTLESLSKFLVLLFIFAYFLLGFAYIINLSPL